MSKCGTTAGYKWHRNHNEIPCQPCKTALRDYKRSIRAADPEKAKAENRATHLKNREKVLARNKAYRKNNPDKVKEYQDNYRVTHKAEREEYRQSNLDKFRGYARNRIAWKYGNKRDKYTEQQVLETYGSDCHICSEPIDMKASRKIGVKDWKRGLNIDHVIPLAQGGSDTLDNVRPAHALCNLKKGGKK